MPLPQQKTDRVADLKRFLFFAFTFMQDPTYLTDCKLEESDIPGLPDFHDDEVNGNCGCEEISCRSCNYDYILQDYFHQGMASVKRKFFLFQDVSYKEVWTELLEKEKEVLFMSIHEWKKNNMLDDREKISLGKTLTTPIHFVEKFNLTRLNFREAFKLGFHIGLLDVLNQMLQLGDPSKNIFNFFKSTTQPTSEKIMNFLRFSNEVLLPEYLVQMEDDLTAKLVGDWKHNLMKIHDPDYLMAQKLEEMLTKEDRGTALFLFDVCGLKAKFNKMHPVAVKRLGKKFDIKFNLTLTEKMSL